MGKRISLTDEQIIAASEQTNSATSAAAFLGIKYDTYRNHAKRLGVFKTNQSGKGVHKPQPDTIKIPLNEILSGMHPQYQSNKIRLRLLSEGIKEHRCESCGGTEWLGFPIPLELDHINGVNSDHQINNLRLLCPNCHAQTDTYRGRNTRARVVER